MDPLLSFPLVTKDDAISDDLKQDDISYCSLCDFQALFTAYGSAAMGQLFFFHVVLIRKKQGFYVSINPWKLINLSRDKAVLAEKTKERLRMQKPEVELDPLKPLPLETKRGPLMNPERNVFDSRTTAPLISKVKLPGSPVRFSTPRRRFSGSPTMFSSVLPSTKQKYRSSFGLKLTEVSRELETYISRQVLCSVIKKVGSEASPRLKKSFQFQGSQPLIKKIHLFVVSILDEASQSP
ncbi:hypothetical protein V6N13_087095 [Hibiscus sabdariffa]|uniref:TPX2 central domain-containing protein n=1 Tax=Hibiscus sabdariffa TaxID=183260 RepID=A0ABR2FVS1_9ROSI